MLVLQFLINLFEFEEGKIFKLEKGKYCNQKKDNIQIRKRKIFKLDKGNSIRKRRIFRLERGKYSNEVKENLEMEDEQEDKNKNKCITPREQARGEKY